MFFSVITKNFNWELLTKNLVSFKRWDGVKYYGGSLKNSIFRGQSFANSSKGWVGEFGDFAG